MADFRDDLDDLRAQFEKWKLEPQVALLAQVRDLFDEALIRAVSDEEPFLDTKEVARRMQLTRQAATARFRRHGARMGATQQADGSWRIDRVQFEEWLAAHEPVAA